MKEARYYTRLENQAVLCRLCPHGCRIEDGRRGICGVRINKAGMLICETYNRICSGNIDPIEKKPLYHFFPGKNIFSIGSIGCNFSCAFCQNYEISQARIDTFQQLKTYLPEDIASLAQKTRNNIGVAYTYNEPTVWFEYMLDCCRQVHEKGMKNVMVTNGFINPEPLAELLPVMDAFNVDLKAFHDDFYRKHSKGSLQPVLDTIKTIAKSGKHLEITNLVIPTLNDDPHIFSQMCKWIADETGKTTSLHISRYFPKHEMTLPATPPQILEKLYDIAEKHLTYVYLGNFYLPDKGNDTLCAGCGKVLISRHRYDVEINGLNLDGTCRHCEKLSTIHHKMPI